MNEQSQTLTNDSWMQLPASSRGQVYIQMPDGTVKKIPRLLAITICQAWVAAVTGLLVQEQEPGT